jgi:hypothetical protein
MNKTKWLPTIGVKNEAKQKAAILDYLKGIGPKFIVMAAILFL